jgi:hypothetical protein
MKDARVRFEESIVMERDICLVEDGLHDLSSTLVHGPSLYRYDCLLEKEVCVNEGEGSYTADTGNRLQLTRTQ